jgi:DNA-binding NtrC family response regulator
MTLGAHDGLTQPVRPDETLTSVAQALEKRRLGARLQRLQQHHGAAFHLGESAAARAMLEKIWKVAPTDSTVLLTGASGVGKDVVATLIHEMGSCSHESSLKINFLVPARILATPSFATPSAA